MKDEDAKKEGDVFRTSDAVGVHVLIDSGHSYQTLNDPLDAARECLRGTITPEQVALLREASEYEEDDWGHMPFEGLRGLVVLLESLVADGQNMIYATEQDAALKAGVVAAMENLRDVVGVGTDKQAYDHVIRRLQDKYGGWDNQVRCGMIRARKILAE